MLQLRRGSVLKVGRTPLNVRSNQMSSKMIPSRSAMALAIGILTAGAIPLHAVTVNLTTAGSSGSANGWFFQQVPDQSTGTGVIDPFVRLIDGGGSVVEGYNATARPVMSQVNTSPTFTHDLQFSAIPQVVNPAGAPA